MCSPGHVAITNLVYRYAELIDAGDLAGVGELFTHGAIDAGGARLEGRDAVTAMYSSVILYDDGTPATKHVTTNLIVDVDEDSGTGTCRSYVTVFQYLSDFPLQPVYQCRYLDSFERVDGEWRFKLREMVDHRPGDTSRHLRA